jgi:predicted TIM-barrel fold metal-dependent hydrolase
VRTTRRQFLCSVGGAGTLAGAVGWLSHQQPGTAVSGAVDFHVHLFGVGDGQTGCWMSETQKKHVNYGYLLRLLGLREGHIDHDYVQALVGQLKTSSLNKVVLQAWDCRYDSRGEPDWERTTSAFIPNSYMLKVVAEHPDLFIPCASINPKRKDAIDELERSAAQGAKVVKIHPPTMDVDPSERRFEAFYRQCAKLKIIVMVHTGTEHSADITDVAFGSLDRLVPALEQGCTVVAAHAGMSAFFDKEDFFSPLRSLIQRFPALYFDTAVLASMFRWRCLPRLMEDPVLLERAIHGSDFPFPSNAMVFWNRLAPTKLAPLLQEKNLLERDYLIKQGLGLPQHVFERAEKLIATAGSAV